MAEFGTTLENCQFVLDLVVQRESVETFLYNRSGVSLNLSKGVSPHFGGPSTYGHR